jgi:hypothetical protein
MPTGRWRLRLLAGTLAVTCGLFVCSQAAFAAGRPHVRLGSAPMTPSSAIIMGDLPNATRLSAVIELKPSDLLALSDYAQNVSTPGSADYGDYLSVDQFR